jgi:hypothetical protein
MSLSAICNNLRGGEYEPERERRYLRESVGRRV